MQKGALMIGMLLCPGLLAAGPFDGIYKQTETSECALVGADGGSLRIADGLFFGVGSQCLMTRPVDVVDMEATLYTMECSGEDQSWIERAMLMHTPERDGIFMIWDGYVFRYDRCPDDTVPLEPRAAPEAEDTQ